MTARPRRAISRVFLNVAAVVVIVASLFEKRAAGLSVSQAIDAVIRDRSRR